jgi:hypothetical protein
MQSRLCAASQQIANLAGCVSAIALPEEERANISEWEYWLSLRQFKLW